MLTTLFLMVAAGGCVSRSRPVHHAGRIITLSDSILRTGGTDTVRFGRMRTGETAVQQLRLINASPQPIVILSALRSCGCTTLQFDSQPIPSQGEAPAELLFDAQGLHGWQFKMVEIHFAGATAPFRLYAEAEVE